ncbi:cytochrome P450 [Podospora conica]|nr:cytochrome P450 [Schizothecium conicum]
MGSPTTLFAEYGTIIGTAVAGLYFIYSLWSWYRLRQFDGPWLARHSYVWLVRTLTDGKFHKTLPELHVKYGSTFRIGPNDLVTDDPELLRRMAGIRGTRTYGRSNWYNTQEFDSRARSVFSDTDTKRHDRYKASMSLGYSGKDVLSFEKDVDEVIKTFMKVLERDHLSNDKETRVADFALLCQFFTLDAISKLGFGEPIGHLEHNSDRFGYINTIDNMIPIISAVSASPLATAITNIPFIKRLIAPSRKDTSGVGRLLLLGDETARAALASDLTTRHDMVASWLRRGYPGDAERLSADIVTQLVAGSDTTATAIKVTTLHLCTNARVLRKLRAELDAAEEAGAISSPVVTNREALALPYLQAVVREGLRIFVPVVAMLMKQVPAGGDVIDGKFVPGGTRVGHSTWSMQRNAVYGRDVERFWPERWIEAGEEERVAMERQLDMMFGLGRWSCLGKPVAKMELNKIFVELFRRFDFEVMNPIEPVAAFPWVLFAVKKMHVRITKREKTT